MNIFHIANLRGHPEHPEQVDSENKDMEESIRIMVNIIRYMCGTIFKMPASRDVKFVINNTKRYMCATISKMPASRDVKFVIKET